MPIQPVSPRPIGRHRRGAAAVCHWQWVLTAVAVALAVAPCLPTALGLLPGAQRDALVALYGATGGSGWTAAGSANWLTGDPCTNGWAGVICSGATTVVCVLPSEF